jgi:hypothetical protein
MVKILQNAMVLKPLHNQAMSNLMIWSYQMESQSQQAQDLIWVIINT